MGVEGIEMSWEELKELGRRVGGVGRVRGAEGISGSWRCCWYEIIPKTVQILTLLIYCFIALLKS